MCVSSQYKRVRKEEGAAVDSSAILPYLSSAGRATAFVGQNGQSTEMSPNHWETLIKYQKRPTVVATAIFSHLIDSPKQMKYKDADESDKIISDLKHKNVNDTNNNCS